MKGVLHHEDGWIKAIAGMKLSRTWGVEGFPIDRFF
jgi:hypothetical protein